jgi:hypothetical protein
VITRLSPGELVWPPPLNSMPPAGAKTPNAGLWTMSVSLPSSPLKVKELRPVKLTGGPPLTV